MIFKYLRIVLPAFPVILANVIWGQSQRPDFNGRWQLEPSHCVLHSRIPSQLIWQIEQRDDAIRLIQRYGDTKVEDLHCVTDGKDCKLTGPTGGGLVSFFYNGPVLVELETEGNQVSVIERRMSLSKRGKRLSVDVRYVVPSGRPSERLVLSREPAAEIQRVRVPR